LRNPIKHAADNANHFTEVALVFGKAAQQARRTQMTIFAVGQATIARIEETYQPVYKPKDLFPEWSEEIFNQHKSWLVPNHYDPASGLVKLSVHSWLLQVGKQKILIDACCGNQKSRPARPFWNMLNTPYLDRLAAAGARPDEIDMVMCTHLHHDHVGWNTQLKDGKWVPTFPNARYVFSKPDFEYFQKADVDPATAPVEFGTFRECVMPVVEAGRADLVAGPHRLNDHIEIIPAPGHSPGHVVFKLESRGKKALFIGDVFHHLLQVYYPHWNFPKNSDVDQARVSRRMILEHSASSGALVLPCHVGAPFAGRIETSANGFQPRFG
jgi:glyoxylase-like metal-dependent hydrolase (beta-lactamase superfamily II)